jgi:hypothetical protein
LPQKGREVIDRLSGEALSLRLMRVIDAAVASSRSRISETPGQSVTRLAPDEEARWAAEVAPAIEEWTRATPDGARVLAAFREEVKRIREMGGKP